MLICFTASLPFSQIPGLTQRTVRCDMIVTKYELVYPWHNPILVYRKENAALELVKTI